MSSAAPPSPFKPTTLAGKVALVTGGGSGIGLEITRQLGGLHQPVGRVQPSRGAAQSTHVAALSLKLQGPRGLLKLQGCMAPKL